MKHIKQILIYLGIGITSQVLFYNDLLLSSIYDGTIPLSVVAHILGWPIFLIFYMFRMMFRLFLIAMIICICAVVYLTIDYMCKKYKNKRNRHYANSRDKISDC
jgi:ABC-type bacteriocin/lantibiotic exporter with double-glycine peptidase domain